MINFQQLEFEFQIAKKEADAFFINENMQAGKRYFASLMRIQARCKSAREELSIMRKQIRNKRKNGVQKV